MTATPEKHKTRRTIRAKIFGGFLLVVVITLTLLWLLQIVLFDLIYASVRLNEVEATARHVKLYRNETSFHKNLAETANKTDSCASLLASDGSVVYDAENTTSCLIHTLSVSERQALIADAGEKALYGVSYEPVSEEYTFTSVSGGILKGASNIIYVEELEHNGAVYYLVLDATVSPVGTVKKATASFLITLSIVLVAIALLLANYTAKRIASPIGEISRQAKTLASGSYTPVASNSLELDELNETLSAAASDLGKLERQRIELIANLSHDLRTPLTLISGYAEMMRDLPSEVTAENLTTVIDEVNRLNSLVNDLLDISLLESGQRRPIPTVFNLSASLEKLLKQYGALTEKDGYRFIADIGEDLTVYADEGMILQVFSNLLNNAMTYTGEDKTVRIETVVQNNAVAVEITDSGCGIAPDKLPLIWERYYKLDDAHKRAAKGTGLGLSIVRDVITAMGGRYGVRSTVQKGSTFWFELPLYTEST